MSRPEVWMILGASSSVARAMARAVAAEADLLLCGRDGEDIGALAADLSIRHGARVEVLDFDATDYAAHADLPLSADDFARGARLNVFVAFGSMPEQAAADADFALARRTVETNYLGVVSVLSRLAPVLEARRAGSVVVLGSVAGDRGRLKNYLYGSAKAGLHAWLQGYRARMHRAGVRVLTVKPGFLDTAMTWPLGPLPLAMAPDDFAKAVLARLRSGAEVAYLPRPWWAIVTLLRAVPEGLFKRTDI